MKFDQNKPTQYIIISCVRDNIHAAVHSSSFHRRLAEEMKFVEVFSSYLKEFDSLLFSNPWLPIKCDVERLFFSPYGNIDKSIWRTYLVNCRWRWSWIHTLSFYDHFQCFSPERIHILNGYWFKVKFLLTLMNLCLTESHILTHVIDCALHLPMLCCAYWNVYCAISGLVLFLYCCCISGVYLWSALSGS